MENILNGKELAEIFGMGELYDISKMSSTDSSETVICNDIEIEHAINNNIN